MASSGKPPFCPVGCYTVRSYSIPNVTMEKKFDRVQLLCENEGAPIPRHRMAFRQAEYEGEYTLREELDRDAKRTVMMARLRIDSVDSLPPLRDARVLYQVKGIVVVTGLEVLNELTRRRTAQTWYIRTVGYQGPGLDLDPLFVAD